MEKGVEGLSLVFYFCWYVEIFGIFRDEEVGFLGFVFEFSEVGFRFCVFIISV